MDKIETINEVESTHSNESLDSELKTAIEAIHKSNSIFVQMAQNGETVSSKTKDLMLSLAGGISSLQFASYQAISNASSSPLETKGYHTPVSKTPSIPLKQMESYGDSEEPNYDD